MDLQRLRVTTASGRIYHLMGAPGYDDDGDYLLEMSSLIAHYTEVTEASCKEHGIAMEVQ